MACLLCGNNRVEKIHYPSTEANKAKLGLKEIANCAACGFAQAIPVPSLEVLDAYYENGQYWHSSSSNSSVLIHNSIQCKFRIKYLKHSLGSIQINRVLDVGAGGGFMADWLHRMLPNKDFQYDFMESDPVMSGKIEEKKLLRKARKTSWSELEAEQYDMIFLNHVVEHVNDPVGFLSKIIKSLKPGGICYVEVPNRDDQFKDDVFPHTLFFGNKSFAFLSEKLNVKTIDVRSFGARAAADKVVSRMFKTKLKMKLFTESTRLPLTPVHSFLDNLLFKYNKPADGLWLSWIFAK